MEMLPLILIGAALLFGTSLGAYVRGFFSKKPKKAKSTEE